VPDRAGRVLQLFRDTENLIDLSYHIISASPLEVYDSGLLLVPRDTLLFATYLHELVETERQLLVMLKKVEGVK
jgi:hypothetical protein